MEGVLLALALALAPQQPHPSAPMPAMPLTQLDDHGLATELDARTFSLAFARPVPIQELLLLLVRGTAISMVPDPAISGSFVGELKNVTARQALGLVLRPLGLDYALEGSVVRVFRREAETRIYDVNYIAAVRTASTNIGADAGVALAVTTSAGGDVFADLANGVRTLLSDRAIFNVDRKAGLLQVTDLPERLDRVSIYLDAVQDRLHRQVQIDARIVEVEIEGAKAAGIDWTPVAEGLASAGPSGPRRTVPPSLTGLRVHDVRRLLDLLGEQGKITVLASPRMLTLNNEPAIVRTEAAAFSVTPQIGGDGVVTLSFSPVVNAPAAIESDMLARVVDGETLVVSGFTRDRESRERKNVGTSGGWFGRGTVVSRKRVEVVILLTPRIISGTATQ